MLETKRLIQFFYILIVGLVVFTGALMIAEGLRTAQRETVQSSERALPSDPGATRFAI